jgi:Zn finger protein HypA/HybF involved in hydrogenase expression
MQTEKKPAQFECMECGKKFYSVEAARRAMFSERGCPKCGGADIDLPRVPETKAVPS